MTGPWVLSAFENAKLGLKVVGGLAAGGALYINLGFPVPATKEYVNTKFQTVQTELQAINVNILAGQRKLIKSDRSFLRMERMSVEAALHAARPDSEDARVLTHRLSEIDDSLTSLTQDDADLRHRQGETR